MILVILIIIKTIKFIIQIIIFLIYVHGWFGFVYKIDMGVGVIDADYRGRKNCAVDS
jgi:dUTPase